jgi:hypothetical protein
MPSLSRIIAACILLAFSADAFAYDTYAGKITRIQVVEGSMQLRISLDITMTNCDLDFAFVETSSSLFSLYSSSFTTAYASLKR